MNAFNVDKLQLPELPAGYFWAVGEGEGLRYENSGILREYGLEWRPTFGVAIKRQKRFLFFKWVDTVAVSKEAVKKESREVKKAAVKVLRAWETS